MFFGGLDLVFPTNQKRRGKKFIGCPRIKNVFICVPKMNESLKSLDSAIDELFE